MTFPTKAGMVRTVCPVWAWTRPLTRSVGAWKFNRKRREIISKMFSKDSSNFEIIIPGPAHIKEAEVVSGLINEAIKDGFSMLPKTPEEILELFANGHSVLVVDKESGEPIAHTAITYRYSDGSVEIGGCVTRKDRRFQGAARLANESVLVLAQRLYPESKKFALVNEREARAIEKIGGKKMDPSQLSPEVWEPCDKCPRKPKLEPGEPFKCCDTPYDLTHLGKER